MIIEIQNNWNSYTKVMKTFKNKVMLVIDLPCYQHIKLLVEQQV